MKVLVLAYCIFAAASAGYAPFYQHVPVIGPNGVPVDTPEVQAAKATHLAAHVSARIGHLGLGLPLALGHAYGVPAIAHNGLPLDTPEVAAAKVQHHIDYATAARLNGVHVHSPIVSAHPVDTPEVQLAKAAHFAAHAEANARNGVHHRKRRGIYNGPIHVPVIDHNGVPVEPPAVQAARANHLAALSAASTGHGYHGAPVAPPTYSGPVAYSSPWGHIPTQIGPDGQPVETPEIQHAKAAHFAAHAAARGYRHY